MTDPNGPYGINTALRFQKDRLQAQHDAQKGLDSPATRRHPEITGHIRGQQAGIAMIRNISFVPPVSPSKATSLKYGARKVGPQTYSSNSFKVSDNHRLPDFTISVNNIAELVKKHLKKGTLDDYLRYQRPDQVAVLSEMIRKDLGNVRVQAVDDVDKVTKQLAHHLETGLFNKTLSSDDDAGHTRRKRWRLFIADIPHMKSVTKNKIKNAIINPLSFALNSALIAGAIIITNQGATEDFASNGRPQNAIQNDIVPQPTSQFNYVVNAEGGLNYRTSMSTNTNDNKAGTLKDGSCVAVKGFAFAGATRWAHVRLQGEMDVPYYVSSKFLSPKPRGYNCP